MFELRAKSDSEVDVLMYGSVSEWSKVNAEDFIKKLSEAKAKNYAKVNCKINCPGGSIFEGLAIMSQMNTQEIFITGIVEGMAASMGAVILQSCHKRKMVKGTRLMVHAGSGGVYGQVNGIRDYADMLESLNKTLAEILSRRSKRKDVKWILDNWMADGKDTWFTPEQALAEGLIDEIIEGNVKPFEKENASILEMAAHYSQFTTDTTQTEMKKEDLIALLGLGANATEDEIKNAITAMKAKAATAVAANPPAPAPAAPGKPEASGDLIVGNVLALAKARGVTDEKQLNAIKTLAGIDVQAAIDLLPAQAAAATEQNPSEAGKAPLNLNDVLNALGGKAKPAGEEANWGYAEWCKHPEKLKALIEKDWKAVAKLIKDYTGHEPTEAEIKASSFN